MDCSVSFQESIEFHKVKVGISAFCVGQPARDKILLLEPHTTYESLTQTLSFQKEIQQLLIQFSNFPLGAYNPLDEETCNVHIEGYVLPIESFLNIRLIIRNLDSIQRFFVQERKQNFPLISKVVFDSPVKRDLIQAIDIILDEQGEIKQNASEELMQIRKLISKKNIELDQEFRRLLAKYRNENLLTESGESMRNGRRVFSVPAEYKRKISGIIHDESATGKTVFIEPDALIQINNEIFSLQIEEKKEIYKILKNTSALFRNEIEYLADIIEIFCHLDVHMSIQKYANQYHGVIPLISNKPEFKWFSAVHPLLYLKNLLTGQQTIPFEFDLHPPNKIILLSGPNAGGKSITMKAVGLIQVMLQCGIPVPVREYSTFGWFNKFYADIGDKQSIEDDLSTYSSHLKNIAIIVQQADPSTLILFDEFGGGTDPKMGGAIAEAVMIQLNRQGAWGVITTHYSNLKLAAFKEKGIVNGAMHFDKESLKPTYQLYIGKPGSSYAFEIARKSGLPEKLLQYAKKKSIEKESQVDDMLIDIQTDKQVLESKLQELKDKEKSMISMMNNLEQARRDLEIRRKKWKLEVKETQAQQNEREIKRLEETLKEWKKNANAETLENQIKEKKKKRITLSEEVVKIQEEIFKPSVGKDLLEIEVGTYVKMLRGETSGIVLALQGKNAIVEIGEMRAKIALKDLEPIKAPIITKQKKSVHIDTAANHVTFVPKIDIRGFTKDEAIRMLDNFLDKAALSSAHQLEILHGKGNGILRNIVKSKLKEYPFVKTIRHPEQSNGGDGITLAYLTI